MILTMNFDGLTFSVTVVDEGEGLVELPEDPDFDRTERSEPPRGLGIFLIKQLTDHVEFNKLSSQGHMMRMVIKMTREAHA